MKPNESPSIPKTTSTATRKTEVTITHSTSRQGENADSFGRSVSPVITAGAATITPRACDAHHTGHDDEYDPPSRASIVAAPTVAQAGMLIKAGNAHSPTTPFRLSRRNGVPNSARRN